MDAPSRRVTAMNVFDKCHVLPSHRRWTHHSWTASVHVLLDLLSLEQGNSAIYVPNPKFFNDLLRGCDLNCLAKLS